MAPVTLTPEKALRELQRFIRRPSADTGVVVMRRRLPADLQTDPPQEIRLEADQAEALRTAIAAVLADLRFEHLDRADDEVWHLVAEAALDAKDHVPDFIKNHQKEPIDAVCYIPVEFLTVTAEIEALGIRLLPVDDVRIPPSGLRPAFNIEKPVGCVPLLMRVAQITGGWQNGRRPRPRMLSAFSASV